MWSLGPLHEAAPKSKKGLRQPGLSSEISQSLPCIGVLHHGGLSGILGFGGSPVEASPIHPVNAVCNQATVSISGKRHPIKAHDESFVRASVGAMILSVRRRSLTRPLAQIVYRSWHDYTLVNGWPGSMESWYTLAVGRRPKPTGSDESSHQSTGRRWRSQTRVGTYVAFCGVRICGKRNLHGSRTNEALNIMCAQLYLKIR